jgi:outer membrane protein assembly factor BamB
MENQNVSKRQLENRRTFLKSIGVIMSATALETGGVAAEEITTNDTGWDEWTTARSDPNRTGAIADDGPTPYATTDRKLELDGSMVNKEPIIANETIYLSVTTDNSPGESEGYIGAYDIKTGDQLWKQTALSAPKTPTIDDELLFVATTVPETLESSNGGLYALDAATGNIAWRRTEMQRWTSPLVAGDRLFTSNTNGAYALNKTTGETIWEVDNIGQLSDGSDGAVSYSNGTIFFSDGTALNATDGSVKWRISDERSVFSNHIVSNGQVYYLRTESVEGDTTRKTIEARSTTDGTVKWDYDLTDRSVVGRKLAIADGYVVFVESIDEVAVTALDTRTGERLWTEDLNGEFFSAPTVANGTVYVGGRYMLPLEVGGGKAIVYAIELTTGNSTWGHLLESESLETSPETPPAAGTPVVTDGKIYTTTYPAGSMLDYEYIYYSNFFVLGSSQTKSADSSTFSTMSD